MKNILPAVCAASLLLSGCAAPKVSSPEQTAFEKHKQEMLKDPSLIRYYTFEDGYGEEVTNHVILEPGRIAQTGGPIGSLTLHTPNPYHILSPGATYSEHSPDMVPMEWTEGRFPGKSAVRTGETTLGLFRSGITGQEFAKGMTFSGWFRMERKNSSCDLIRLGDAWNNGFRITYSINRHSPNGSLEFRIGDKGKTILHASPCEPEIWHHIAVTAGNGSAKLYLDGKRKAEKPFAGTVLPVKVSDYPTCLPFFENGPSSAAYLLIGANPRSSKQPPRIRFDLDELAIYNRALSSGEILHSMKSGISTETPEQQRAAFAEQKKKEALLKQIRMEIPRNSDGYFRISSPLPAIFSVPAELKGGFKAVFELETLDGKPVRTLEKKISGGQKITENLRFPSCGIYWLDMKLLSADGKSVKRIPEKFCIAIVPPAPAKLTENNPMAYWADWYSLFHYDAPLRRIQYHGNGEHFEKIYSGYAKRIPGFRAYLWFYSLYIKPPKEGWEAGREKNRKLFTEAAKRFQGKKIIAFEMTSEPHNIDPKWYVRHLADARKIFNDAGLRQPMIPPGGAPPSIPMISDILKAGGDKYMDGISYHPYTTEPIHTYLFANSMNRLKEITKAYPKKFIFWNTESGIEALPRMKYRPMRRSDAYAARMPSRGEFFLGFISCVPEAEAAHIGAQDVLMSLLTGYKIYTHCGSPANGGNPSLRGVALTALAGQILNRFESISRIPTAEITNMCLLVKQTDGTRIAAIFGEKPALLTFRLAPSAEYRTMDVYGNYGKMKTDADGMFAFRSTPAPFYIFNVPANMSEVVPLKLELPETISERGELKGKLSVVNPYRNVLKGTLSPRSVHGAEISVSEQQIVLAPGESKLIELSILGKKLKRKGYTFCVDLKDGEGKVIASVSKAVQSPGVIRMVPRIRKPMPLDGDPGKWKNIPAMVCDSVDSVVHGKPNYAEIWVPQWLGKKDLSFSVKTCWRKGDGVYFLLDVTDDALLPAPDDKTWLAFRYDCLELFFDSRPAKHQGSALSEGADQVVVIPRDTIKAAPCKLWYARKNREHITVECIGRKTADGWLIEGKIQPNEKSSFQVQAGSQFRMDFLVDDTDRDESKWLRKSAMALDGNFNNAQNSNVWGRYELSLDTVK